MISHQLLKGVLTYGGADFLFRLIGFAIFPVYANIFSVADFGLMAILSVSAGLMGMLLNMGVNNAVQRFYWDPETLDGHHAILVSAGLRQLVVYGAIVTVAIIFSLYGASQFIYDRFGIGWELLILALLAILPDQIVQYALDILRLQFSPYRFMILSFLKNIMGIVIGLWLIVWCDEGLHGFFEGNLISLIFTMPLALLLIRKELVWSLNKEAAKKIFHFGYPFIFTGLAYWIFGSMDRWLIAELSNTAEVGIFSIAFKFSAVIIFINSAFSQAWSPYAVKLMRDDKNYRVTYSSVLSALFFILAIIGCAMALFADELLVFLTPVEYWPAARVIGLVAMGLVFFGTTQITALGISLEKKTRILSYGAWLAALVNFLLNIALIPNYGAIGSALSTLVAYLTLTCFYLYWTQKLHPIPLEMRKLIYSAMVVLIGLLSPFFLSAFRSSGILLICKLLLLGFLIGGAWFFQILNEKWFRNFHFKGKW